MILHLPLRIELLQKFQTLSRPLVASPFTHPSVSRATRPGPRLRAAHRATHTLGPAQADRSPLALPSAARLPRTCPDRASRSYTISRSLDQLLYGPAPTRLGSDRPGSGSNPKPAATLHGLPRHHLHGQSSNSPIEDLGEQDFPEYDLLSPRRSWQAPPHGRRQAPHLSGVDKPFVPGSFDKRLAYPSASRQIATAETRSLLVNLARKGAALCHLPTRPQARNIPAGAATARGRQQRDEQGGRS